MKLNIQVNGIKVKTNRGEKMEIDNMSAEMELSAKKLKDIIREVEGTVAEKICTIEE